VTNSNTTLSSFSLPPLPYDHSALAPCLSKETLETHHGKHHARYIEVLNRLLAERKASPATMEEIIRTTDGKDRQVFNNAAQAWNHAFFWECMTPKYAEPNGVLAAAITRDFGSLDALKQRFTAEGAGHFGSGWAWLISRKGSLSVVSTHDAATPITEMDATPILTCDVWEHAYYIDYRQDRAGWLGTWWDKLVNWEFAAAQYSASLGERGAWHFPRPAR